MYACIIYSCHKYNIIFKYFKNPLLVEVLVPFDFIYKLR